MPNRKRDCSDVSSHVTLNYQDFPELTKREMDVLARLVNGQTSKDAAEELAISPRTIELHMTRIADKIHARNVADIVRIALMRMLAPTGNTPG